MSAFSACPPVQNTSAEGLQDQGAPPMRSANENPPPTPSPLSADELNRWSSPPPPPLERCAPTADEFQGVSPMAASAASLPFFCPPSFQNVVNRTSVYPHEQFASSGGQGCFFPPTFPPSRVLECPAPTPLILPMDVGRGGTCRTHVASAATNFLNASRPMTMRRARAGAPRTFSS